tara:strand:- start:213 stop:389 length:177 start_codon:yes stop_codon:yes gene_type:complete
MINKDDELETLRRINIELMEENEQLRNKIEALEELAISSNIEYNDDMLWDRKAWEEID